MSKRPVIVHFHLFKNAGTSVDRILETNFGPGGWAEIEGPNSKKLEPRALLDFIRKNPDLKAVSSHTAVVSVPEAEDIEILPILLLRHPIDRIRSAYDFERKQDATTPGALKAKEGDFVDYMEWRLSSPAPWQVSNFHVMRLKDYESFTPAKLTDRLLPQAKKAVDGLPVIGFVEDFDQSMQRFEEFIKRYFPDFRVEDVRENMTVKHNSTLEENLESFKERIGKSAYEKLVSVNASDFELYRYARAHA